MKESISNVYNCDCLELMRALPDNFFSLAIVDPPYGDGQSEQGEYWSRFGPRFDKYKLQITPPIRARENSASTQASGQIPAKRKPYNRFGGLFNRYKPIEGSTTLGGGRFERYATHKTAHERREDAEILPFLDGRTDGEETKVKYGTIDWDVAPPQEYWDELFRVSKNQIIWGGNYFSLPPTRCFVVWRKLSINETFSMAMAEYAWTSFNDNAKYFECVPQRGETSAKFHPTEKPIKLYTWLLNHFAHDGDKIFDSHMGSQNSRIAAYNLGLDYWGCEIDSQYFEKGCAHFDEICHGIKKLKDGRTLKETSIFDLLQDET